MLLVRGSGKRAGGGGQWENQGWLRLQTAGGVVHLISKNFLDRSLKRFSMWLHARTCIFFPPPLLGRCRMSKLWQSGRGFSEGRAYEGCPSRSVGLFQAFRKPQKRLHSTQISVVERGKKKKDGGGSRGVGRAVGWSCSRQALCRKHLRWRSRARDAVGCSLLPLILRPLSVDDEGRSRRETKHNKNKTKTKAEVENFFFSCC